MPHSLVLNLLPQSPIPPQYLTGRHLHALFLTLVSSVDSTLGDRLHDSTADKAFTLSPLLKGGKLKSPPVVVNFQGGEVTSDAGLSLIAEIDRKLQITSQLAGCFQDYRQANRIDHSIESLIKQRIYGLFMGYEDLNDHEELRHDPMFALVLGKTIGLENEPAILTAKSTLNRLEHCPEDVEQGGV